MELSVPGFADREEAFGAVAAMAEQLAQDGRSTLSANVKLSLQKASGGKFTEKVWGYSSFREFLQSAEGAGYVRLASDDNSPDVHVLPRLPPPVAAPTREPRRTLRVREDLWTAFTTWDTGVLRFFRLSDARAYTIPANPQPNEGPEHAELRAAYVAQSTDFVTIERISPATVKDWMLEFSAELPNPLGEQLTASLSEDRPFAAFKHHLSAAHADPKWHRFHAARVVAWVEKWAETHGLALDLHTMPAKPVSAPAPLTAGDTAEDRLRALAHKVIDRMTVEQLRALPITLGTAADL